MPRRPIFFGPIPNKWAFDYLETDLPGMDQFPNLHNPPYGAIRARWGNPVCRCGFGYGALCSSARYHEFTPILNTKPTPNTNQRCGATRPPLSRGDKNQHLTRTNDAIARNRRKERKRRRPSWAGKSPPPNLKFCRRNNLSPLGGL